MARLIGDGAISLHIVDVIVAKSKRRQGVGRDLMKTLIDAMKSKYAPEASVTLMAARDQSRFYEALGFTPRPSAHFGPGMIAPLGDL